MNWLTALAATLIAAGLLSGCATAPPVGADTGEMQVRGRQSGTWNGKDPARARNVDIEYETVAWHGSTSSPFHRMKTNLEVSYDPKTGEILNAHLNSPEPGKAYRHVCLSPEGNVLHVRVATVFDGGSEDLTILQMHEDRVSAEACDDVGVGPADGLVESFDVLFRPDGTYRVLPDRKAYLAGAKLRVRRTLVAGGEEVTASYP